MKKLYILLLLLTVSGITGCKKKFLEVQPEFLFPAEFAVTSLADLERVDIAMLNAIQDGSLYGGGLIANSEMMADFVETDPISDFSLNQLRTRSLNSFNGQAGGLWNAGYKAINIANIILDRLPEFEAEDAAIAAKLRGEALFVRAICHFELVRMFAQPAGFTGGNNHVGIPIRDFPGSVTEGQNIARSTVAEVYDFIITDLMAADLLLPEDKSQPVSRFAAQAFLAKAYFQLKNYPNAETWSSAVIESGKFSLDSTVKIPFELSGNSWGDEMIFQIINVDEDVVNGDIGRFRGNDNSLYKIDPDLTTILEAGEINGDERTMLNFVQLASFLPWWTNKWSNSNANVPVVRLAEMYLIRAESRLENGAAHTDIRADYNMTRVRANLLADTTSTSTAVMRAIIDAERAIELAYEGDRFHDLKRKQLDFHTDAGIFPWNDPKLVYPIPQQEVEENDAMVQNTGY